MFNVVLINFDQIIFFCWSGTFPAPDQKFIKNISRSKPRLFDTSTYSLMTHFGRQPDGKQGFYHPQVRKWRAWYYRFETFANKFSLQVTLIADVIFQFCRHYQKLLLVCEILISDVIAWVIVIVLSKSKVHFNTMFRSWDTKGAQLPPLNTLHIIMNSKTLKNW